MYECLSNFSLSFCHYQLINCSLCVHCSITSIMCAWLLMRTHRFLILLTTTLMCFRCRLDSSFSVCSSVSSHYCCCCKVTSSQVCVCCKPECQQERPESCGYCGNWRFGQRKDFLLQMLEIQKGLRLINWNICWFHLD